MNLRRVLQTSTFQLTLGYGVVLAGSLAILAAFLYWSTVGYMHRQIEATISAEVTGLTEQYRSRRLNGLVQVIRQRIQQQSDPGALYLIADRSLRPLAGNLPEWPALVDRADGWHSFRYATVGGEIPARAQVFLLPEGLVLLVGRKTPELTRITTLFFGAFAWGGGIALALALLGGLIMSGNVLRRVEQINETTAQIISGDLSQRMRSRDTDDEFDQLAANLNVMLDTIENLMGGVRQVANNIAHDLRTPLSKLRNALEEANETDNREQARELTKRAIADADGLLQTFAALLRISRIESGGYRAGRQPVALSAVVRDAIELYQAIAEDRHISITTELVDAGDEVPGDRDLLFQMTVNLLDNALKYSPDHSTVTVSLARHGQGLLLQIGDSGPGIPAEDRDRVFERFVRLDASRQLPGNGLGLSLVRAIAGLHGADIALANSENGLVVSVFFAISKERIAT